MWEKYTVHGKADKTRAQREAQEDVLQGGSGALAYRCIHEAVVHELMERTAHPAAVLRGHEGEVQALAFDDHEQFLFAG